MIVDSMTHEEVYKELERNVTHIAREHGVTNDVVWKQMLLVATERQYKELEIEIL